MYEWFSLSFIPGAYLKQTSPPYKPATVLTHSINLTGSCRAYCKRIQLESSSLPFSYTPTLESTDSRSHGLAEVHIAVDSQSS